MGPSKARKRLACIRCVLDTVKSIKENRALPKELCFVPLTCDYVLSPELHKSVKGKPSLHFSVWSVPSKKDGKLVGRINVSDYKDFKLTAYGEEFSNDTGDWIQLTKECAKSAIDVVLDPEGISAWILLHPRENKGENNPSLIPKSELSDNAGKQDQSRDDIFGGWISGNEKKTDGSRRMKKCHNWRNLVETNYMLHILPPSLPSNIDEVATSRLSQPLPNWSLEADEELVRFLVDHCKLQEQYMGGASKFIEQITASTEQESAYNLFDDESDTFWESDGSLGRHYIQLKITPGVIIQRLIVGVDQSDDNYMPSRFLISGTTESGVVKSLNEVRIDSTHTGDVIVLENATEYYAMVEIRIKECKDDGIDCRLHYVKIVSSKHKQNGLNRNLFDRNLVRYPKLESVDVKNRELLYRRALALNRFITLFDHVIQYLLPAWEFTVGTYNDLETTRQLLPLSRKRPALIENCLKESQSMAPASAPKICINRHLAAQHLVDPTAEPSGKNSLFDQLYEALRQERCETKLDYRWPVKYDQWWECKFIGEGIIDQGGGFRDSLSDLAEELCPSSNDVLLLPLPFFVRSPNQNTTSNVYRDCYVPNSECKLFLKFEWIGLLMGACLRGKENLVIFLPPFIWKMLNRETLSFEKDYYTVDATEVKFHESLQNIDESKFKDNFEGILSYTSVMANGDIVPLKENGENEHVKYEDRMGFLNLVKEKRMNEFNEQVDAIRNGLEKVVPKAVLGLMTWQELERRICGDPEITLEVLKKSTHYEGFEDESETTIKYLWQSLENFTNEDRSRFLRFVTGRRRLPTPLYISRSKSNTPVNSLPESATCSHTLYLPSYSNAAIAEEKIRYAAYNCVAIDTDMSPWED